MKKQIEKIGLMLDCSRNAVPTPETLKTLIDMLAKMGYNRLELYTEDTYEIKGRPYFGYMRGRYTGAELKEIDAYAAAKGIELEPCIQVLAHLNQMFRWPVFQGVRDCNDILLVDEPETYKLIGDMFAAIAENFTSRNVNIGCDEAHMAGLGRFLDKRGYQNRFDIINRHIGRVLEIAGKYGFKCSMWSDMYFRLAFGGNYYNPEDKPIPREILERVPKGVRLIYWDYYSVDTAHYRKMFKCHKAFGNEIEFAAGAWKFNCLVPDNAHSMKTAKAAITTAREFEIKTAMLTAWGDDGNETSIFSRLPAFYYFARLCKGESIEPADLEKGFRKIAGIGFKDFLDIEIIDSLAWVPIVDKASLANTKTPASKYFFYNDCFSGLMDYYVSGKEAAHYNAVSNRLRAGKYGRFSYIFKTILALSDVLEIKADIGVRTRALYKKGDREGLKRLAAEYSIIIKRIAVFHKRFEKQWLCENKPFGFEIQDMRIGGLKQRVESCRRRLLEYCAGKVKKIPELDEDVLQFGNNQEWFEGAPHLSMISANVPSHNYFQT